MNFRRFVSTQVTYLVLSLSALCAICGYSSAQDWRTLKPGVEYAEVTKEISGLNVNINLLRLDLTKVRLDVHHAMDAAIGTEKTSSIATRHGAFAAINAGFFRLDNSIWAGDSVGLLISNRVLLSESSNNRVCFLAANLANETIVTIGKRIFTLDRVSTKTFGTALSGLNRERKADEIVRFTSAFGASTLTNPDGMEIIVRQNKIVEVNDLAGSSKIPSDGYVLSASGKKREELIGRVKVGQKITLDSGGGVDHFNHFYTPEEQALIRAYGQSDSVVAGAPQLISSGKIDITWEEEKASKSFVETRHPRTGVAKLKDGKFLMITVDGRSESSGGISLYDLADYLLSLGATDAMNLDGGGSTTMFVDGRVVNHPSDKEGERKVSDAILVTLRKK